MNISYSPIGYFKSPYTEIKGMPIQPIGAEDRSFFHETDTCQRYLCFS